MIVPFIFGVEEDPVHYLWIFYKYMDFCLKNNYPIISQEEYFKKPSYFKSMGHYAFNNIKNGYNTMYEFNEPTDDGMKNLKKYYISKNDQNSIFLKYDDKHQASVDLMSNRNLDLENLIQQKIYEVEKKEKKKIKVILSWIWFPSLEFITKKNNIQLIVQEQSTIRKGNYNCYLGYCSFNNKYESKQTEINYKKFVNSLGNIRLFSRKELLSLFLATSNLHYINDIDNIPKYEFGVDLGMDKDAYFEAFSKYKHDYLIEKCTNLVGKNKIIGRTHPMRPSKNKCYIMDNSINSIEWILKCKRIVSTVSNVGFETMLYGRTSYILGNNMPFSCCAVDSLEYLDDFVASITFLNYIIFCYFTPFELMFDDDYLLWRLDNPSELDIYNYHLNYILQKYNLNNDIFNKNSDERLKQILKNVHKLNKDEIEKFINHNLDMYYKNIEEENQILKNEIIQIKNSKCWKLIEQVRKIIHSIR